MMISKEFRALDLLDKGYALRIRNGYNYKLKLHTINNHEDLDNHISSSKMRIEDMSIDLVLGDPFLKNYQLACVDIDYKHIWGPTVLFINSEPGLKVIINPTNRGGHLIFNKGCPSLKKVKALCNLGFKVDYLNKAVNIISLGKHIQGEIPAIHDLSACPKPLQISSFKKTEPILIDELIKEGSRNSTLFEWVNKNHESSILICQHAMHAYVSCT